MLALALAALTLVSVAPAHAADEPIPAKGRFGVGDSIMLSSEDELAAVEVPVNAEVGRQFDAGLPVVRWRAAHGKLPRIVIVHLGTNGPIDPADCDELVALAPHRRIFLVSVQVPRSWFRSNNAILRACAARYDRVFMVRWSAFSRTHPEWFATDGYHLNVDGQEAFATLIDETVDATLALLRSRR
jgi:hypothetical protein